MGQATHSWMIMQIKISRKETIYWWSKPRRTLRLPTTRAMGASMGMFQIKHTRGQHLQTI